MDSKFSGDGDSTNPQTNGSSQFYQETTHGNATTDGMDTNITGRTDQSQADLTSTSAETNGSGAAGQESTHGNLGMETNTSSRMSPPGHGGRGSLSKGKRKAPSTDPSPNEHSSNKRPRRVQATQMVLPSATNNPGLESQVHKIGEINRRYSTTYIDADRRQFTLILDGKAIWKYLRSIPRRDRNNHIVGSGGTKNCVIFKCKMPTEAHPETEETKEVTVVVKQIRTHKTDMEMDMASKANTEINFSHDCIVKFFGICKYNGHYNIVMERCHGSLDSLIRNSGSGTKTPTAVVGRILYCLISALVYLYDRKVYHCDVKPSNILYLKDSSVFKLTDFNISSNQFTNKLTGAPRKGQTNLYVPPTFALYPTTVTGCAYDIWSAGTTLIEMAMLENPVTVAAAQHFEKLAKGLPTAEIIDWLQLKAESNDGDPFTLTHILQDDQDLLAVIKAMTCTQDAYRIRYYAASDEMEKVKRGDWYMGPDEGLIGHQVMTAYSGLPKMTNDEHEKTVLEYVNTVHGRRHSLS